MIILHKVILYSPAWPIDRSKHFALALKLSTRVWKEFHNSSSKDKDSFQFTFPEFVRLVVNGTKKFAADEYMSQVAQVLSIIKKSSLWRFLLVF